MEREYFKSKRIDEAVFARIQGLSYKENDTIPVEMLRYIPVLHYDFQNKVQAGELIVNERIAKEVCQIFQKLYEVQYPIEKIKLVDEYGADDILSMEDNNSSAFNYRVIDGTDILSNHARGLAIDINPLYNPYVRIKNAQQYVLPTNGMKFADRSLDNPYYIKKDDICYEIFAFYGFTWGGEWSDSKDYQHFEKCLE